MKACDDRWREELLEHAAGSPASAAFMEHLSGCAVCSATLRHWKARMENLDANLRQLAASEPSSGLQARVMMAVESSPLRPRYKFMGGWALAAAAVAIAIAAVVGLVGKINSARQESALHAAQTLAQWRAPTDLLLQTPGHEFLYQVPRLGDSYIQISIERKKGGNK